MISAFQERAGHGAGAEDAGVEIEWAACLLRQAVGVEEHRPVSADELDLVDGGQSRAMAALA
jgi:hypothetical protein